MELLNWLVLGQFFKNGFYLIQYKQQCPRIVNNWGILFFVQISFTQLWMASQALVSFLFALALVIATVRCNSEGIDSINSFLPASLYVHRYHHQCPFKTFVWSWVLFHSHCLQNTVVWQTVDVLSAWKATLVDPNNVLQSWDPTLLNPCNWFHITCNSENSVTRVYVFCHSFL